MKRITIRDMLDFYDYTLRKTVRNKDKLVKFELHKSLYVKYIVDVLNGDQKFSHYYNIFLIYEPKPRLIMSLNMTDKIVNHYFTTNCLIPRLDKVLDDRNVATRVGKGTDYALRLVKRYIEFYKRKNAKFYVLKIDINKFFYSIDHEVLKKLLREDLDEDDYCFVSKIIDSTNYDYINKRIKKILKRNPKLKLPLYEYGKGLPIGNLSSQCLSIYYLNRLDHYIVHDLHLKHYVRYMDDFLIFSDNRNYLHECRDLIVGILKNVYKLKINPNKTYICDGDLGFVFLGYRFCVYNNRTIMLIKHSSLMNMKRRVRRNIHLYKSGELDFDKFFASMTNYYYSYRSNRIKVRNILDGYLM